MGKELTDGSQHEQNPWRTLSSRKIYSNSWVSVREDAVIRHDGQEGIYGVVHFKNIAVGVLAVDGDSIFLVGQYRYPLNLYSWEVPEGGCPEGEDPLSAAKRELKEETGLRAANWEKLGEAHLSNSVSDEYAVWYLATNLTQEEASPEGSEKLAVRKMDFEEALEWALSGKITDAISVMAILGFALRRARGLTS